eukprot:TRINITY_DN324_c0_g1_i1.p1 TRINITY_DN324_c0_g1~~TRINITY_DN324_c0_g1_i1.p1  ORF type:complete len:1344 (-),score=532.25 TRINITY_DN324_c0_g1_i1:50-4081(-)
MPAKKRQIVEESSSEEEELVIRKKGGKKVEKTIVKSTSSSESDQEEEKEEEEEKKKENDNEEEEEIEKEEEKENLEKENVERKESSQKQSGPKPRLMIPKMVLENFKSYAGKQEVGPFHKCFSSVVGPNGSGKSNVIDAMLFVFGKRAKQLRHNKVSELIHKSEKYPSLTFCKVSVYFQEIMDKEGEEYDVIPGSEFVVTRMGYDNNSSKYFIGEKSAKWEEVSAHLQSKGIDLDHNRFLILQGEVEQIAMMKPKAQNPHDEGMLEYLEDIIGTSKYVELIQSKESQLETADQARNERLNRLKHAEKEREGLESSKIEAEEYLQKEREIIDLKSIQYQIYRSNNEEKVSLVVKEKEKIEKKLENEKEKVSENAQELEKLEEEYKKGRKEYEAIEKKMLEAKEEFAIFERKDINYREEIKHLKSKEKKLGDSIAKETKSVNDKNNDVKRNTADIERFEREVTKLQSTKEKEEKALDKIYSSLQSETEGFQSELDKKQTELAPLSATYNQTRSEFNLKQQKLTFLIEKATSGRKKLGEVQTKIDQLSSSIPKRDLDLKNLKESIKKNKADLPKAVKELEEISKQEQKSGIQVRDLRNKFEEDKRNAQESSKSSKLVTSIMEASKKKHLEGICGRLGDLGSIDAKYDVAISTACPGLNHIVVERTEDGEAALKFLRENNLGIATFLILEKMEKNVTASKVPFKAPSDSQRLFDLVKPKSDKYLGAFYHALGNTLVCSGIDLATKIGYGKGGDKQRHRVVTFEGQVIELSGAMTGGGHQVLSGGMKASLNSGTNKEELKAMEEELKEKEEEILELRKRKQELEDRIEDLKATVLRMETEVNKAEMDVTSFKTQIEELKSQIPELKEEAKSDPEEEKKIKMKQKKLDSLGDKVEKERKVMRKVEEVCEEIQQKIMKVGGARLAAQKAKVDSAIEQIDTLASNTTKAHAAIKALEKGIKKSETLIENSESEIQKVREDLEKIRSESKQAEKEAEQVIEHYKQTEAKMTEKAKELKAHRESLEGIKKVVDKFRTLEVDLLHQISDYEKSIRTEQENVQRWSKKLSELEKQKARTKIEEDDEDEPMPVIGEEQLAEYDAEEITSNIAQLEEGLSRMKPNMNAIREYRKKEKDYKEKFAELEEATNARDVVRKEYDTLRKKRLDEFMEGYSEITRRLKEMYQMITLGGDAELELVDSCDPFSEGILFSVRPPKKSWKNISNLSGGEKTLSSLALVFALHHYRPTPLYVMDEIDAALDFKNVSIVAHYIKERTKDAQFIIISLRNYMFELANHLVGIYKTGNCTKSVTIDPQAFTLPFQQAPSSSRTQRGENDENDKTLVNSQRTGRKSQLIS